MSNALMARLVGPMAALLFSGCYLDDALYAKTAPDNAAGVSAAGENAGGESAGGSEGQGGSSPIGQRYEPKTPAERCAELDAKVGVARPDGWAVESHCKEAEPRYDLLFGSQLKRLDLVVTSTVQAAMEQDLAELMKEGGQPGAPCEGLQVGSQCTSGEGTGVCRELWANLVCYTTPPLEQTQPCEGKNEGQSCSVAGSPGHCISDGVTLVCGATHPPQNGQPIGDDCVDKNLEAACQLGTQGAMGKCARSGRLVACQGPLDDVKEPDVPLDAAASVWPRDPKYFEATIRFDGHEWQHVGYRYKGNSGLQSAASNKRPFRLKLDELESEYPEITDQRIYGFKELSFSPGGGIDTTFLRQVVTSEMFARANVATPKSVLVQVYLDQGTGPELLGVYAMTEIPGDPLTKRAFEDKNGCLYKPDGLGAHLLGFHSESFHTKSDACPVDKYDVQQLISALNADIVDQKAWRERLGQMIDLPALVRFFATNQANGNWDTYGRMAHNYFLYRKTSGGPLHFIPWDFDLSLDASSASDFSLDAVSGEWPLLQAIARDVELYSAYHVALEEVVAREYDSGLLAERVKELSAQVQPMLADEGVDPDTYAANIKELQFSLSEAGYGLRAYLETRGFAADPCEPCVSAQEGCAELP